MTTDPAPDAQLLLQAAADPLPAWDPAHALPWADPAFSARIMRAHLDPDSPTATRPPDVVKRHIDWLLQRVGTSPAHILDVCCGPGLYCHELARRGHTAVGCDIAPAALDWARTTATVEGLDCTFLTADLQSPPTNLAADLSSDHAPFHAITCWFGDFHAFPRPAAEHLLKILASLLEPGGLLILELQPWDDVVRDSGLTSVNELTCDDVPAGIFCDRPHLWVQRHRWDEATETEVHGHWILEQESGTLHRYVQCHQAWRPDRLAALLLGAGLDRPEWHDPIAGIDESYEFPVLVARRANDSPEPGAQHPC